MHRQALTATGLFMALGGSTGLAEAQANRGVPNPDTPKLLVPTFRVGPNTADRGLGVQGADAIRNRVSQEFTIKQLVAIPKDQVNETLKASGYNPDSALSPTDIKELAKLMRADEIIDGEVERLADGSLKITARMLLSRDVSLSQPLGTVTARSLGDAAKPIAKELSEARKQLKDNRDCENHLRAQKWDEAIASANKGIAVYPKATLARLCLASALSSKKAPGDQIIKVSDEVLAVDPTNRFALGLKYGALKEKGENAAAVATLVAMQKADPTNTTLAEQVARELAVLDPKLAVPILDTLVAQNPGDPNLVKTQWQVLLRANEFARALTVGEELVKIDTAAMDSVWFTRMTAAAGAANQAQKAAEYAARAVQRFPKSAGFLALQSQMLRKSGQIPQAVAAMQRAVEIDPKTDNGFLAIVVGFSDMGRADSAKAWAQKAIAAGTPPENISNALLTGVGPLIQKAQASKSRADWREALTVAQSVNAIARTPNSAFFTGVAAFQIGLDAVQNINKTRSCAEVNLAEEMFNIASTEVLFGAKVDTGSAGQIMNAIQSITPQLPQIKRQVCKR